MKIRITKEVIFNVQNDYLFLSNSPLRFLSNVYVTVLFFNILCVSAYVSRTAKMKRSFPADITTNLMGSIKE